MLLDTETSTDPTQRLLFGSYQLCEWSKPDVNGSHTLHVLEEGLFYGDDLPRRDRAGMAILKDYARTIAAEVPRTAPTTIMPLYSRRGFVEEVLWKAGYRGRALITGFNLPFDLSRLAVGWDATHRYRGFERFVGGFSFTLWVQPPKRGLASIANPYRPRIRIKHIDRNRSFFEFTSFQVAESRIPWKRESGVLHGHFLDLKTLAFALTDESLSLDRACKAFGVPLKKGKPQGHGVITPDYIDYNRDDVGLTRLLLERLRAEFDHHPIGVDPWEVYSSATIAKGYLRTMGVTPPRDRAKQVSKPRLGAAMSAYYGGRAECRIRGTVVPVVHTDVTSMYPAVHSLARIWELVTARRLRAVDATANAQAVLRSVTLERCLTKTIWPRLRFFAQIVPQSDILPVRAEYEPDTRARSIGLNHLTSQEPMWYTGFDLAQSVLLTGRVPTIRKAFAIVGEGQLPSLEGTQLRGQVAVDPARDDFFRRVIEERHRVQTDGTIDDEERKRLRAALKVIANSGSYGVLAQFDQRSLPGKQRQEITVYGRGSSYRYQTKNPEDPGKYCFPPIAALITGAARLVLACLERVVTDAGGTYLFTDTDSMAIVAARHAHKVACPGGPHRLSDGCEAIQALSWTQVHAIVKQFEPLKPFGREVRSTFLKIEDENFVNGKQVQLYGFGISAKRYCLFTIEEDDEIVMRKCSKHSLRLLLSPEDPDDPDEEEDEEQQDPNDGWIADTWRGWVAEVLGRGPGPALPWAARPAVTRITLSSPHVVKPFVRGAPIKGGYPNQFKPFNFGLGVQVRPLGHPRNVDPDRCRLVGPFSRDPREWLAAEWVDIDSKRRVRIATNREPAPNIAAVKTVAEYLAQYRIHPEAKSNGPDGAPCDHETVGLLQRRHITPLDIIHTGKESNRLEAQEEGLLQPHEEDVRDDYPEPEISASRKQAILAAVRQLPVDEVVARTGVSRRTVFRVLKTGQASRRTWEKLKALM